MLAFSGIYMSIDEFTYPCIFFASHIPTPTAPPPQTVGVGGVGVLEAKIYQCMYYYGYVNVDIWTDSSEGLQADSS
jgi:hypothetical protein